MVKKNGVVQDRPGPRDTVEFLNPKVNYSVYAPAGVGQPDFLWRLTVFRSSVLMKD